MERTPSPPLCSGESTDHISPRRHLRSAIPDSLQKTTSHLNEHPNPCASSKMMLFGLGNLFYGNAPNPHPPKPQPTSSTAASNPTQSPSSSSTPSLYYPKIASSPAVRLFFPSFPRPQKKTKPECHTTTAFLYVCGKSIVSADIFMIQSDGVARPRNPHSADRGTRPRASRGNWSI